MEILKVDRWLSVYQTHSSLLGRTLHIPQRSFRRLQRDAFFGESFLFIGKWKRGP